MHSTNTDDRASPTYTDVPGNREKVHLARTDRASASAEPIILADASPLQVIMSNDEVMLRHDTDVCFRLD